MLIRARLSLVSAWIQQCLGGLEAGLASVPAPKSAPLMVFGLGVACGLLAQNPAQDLPGTDTTQLRIICSVQVPRLIFSRVASTFEAYGSLNKRLLSASGNCFQLQYSSKLVSEGWASCD